MKRFPRITVNPQQIGGMPCIRGLRITVATVVGIVGEGMTETEILRAYPDLHPEDIRECPLLLFASKLTINMARLRCENYS